MVYSGYPQEDGKHAEIIDLLNPDANCDEFGTLERGVDYAFGGKVADNSYVVCGGGDGSLVIRKECYKVGETTPFLELLQPRSDGASVVLPNNTLFITGESSYYS